MFHSFTNIVNSPEPFNKNTNPVISSDNDNLIKLPIDDYKDIILKNLEINDVTCINGETGCGKSSRIPRYIYDKCRINNLKARIIVVQPRRVACISLARRVAAELGQPLGVSVGYRIKDEGKNPTDQRHSIIFATIGWFLSFLISSPEHLLKYTHLILDEVHERSIEADLLSLVIKLFLNSKILKSKVIVMSATLQGDIFANYFRNNDIKADEPLLKNETIFVGFKKFNVECFYIVDLYKNINNSSIIRRLLEKNKLSQCVWSIKAKEVVKQIEQFEFKSHKIELVKLNPFIISGPNKSLWKYKIFVLHSSIPIEDQQQIFKEPEQNTVHVIISTNIAESSLTIPKVRVIFDTCLQKKLLYDNSTHKTSLTLFWGNKSICKQRLGRTGRVFEGVCFRLIPNKLFMDFTDFCESAMSSTSLDQTYLKVKDLGIKLSSSFKLFKNIKQIFSPKELLSLCLEPPDFTSVDTSVEHLHILGALDSIEENSNITNLGYVCMKLPIDMNISRILWGIPVDGILIASALASTDPFHQPHIFLSRNPKILSDSIQSTLRSRDYFDDDLYSEPIMIRNLLVDWIYFLKKNMSTYLQENNSNQISYYHLMSDFISKHSLVKKNFISMISTVIDIGTRTINLMDPITSSLSLKDIKKLIKIMSIYEYNGTRENFEINFDKEIFIPTTISNHYLYLKSLITASLAPNFIIGKARNSSQRQTLIQGN